MRRPFLLLIYFFIHLGALWGQSYMEVTTQPQDTLAGQVVAGHPVVTVYDASDDPVEGIEVTVALNKKDFNVSSTDTLNTNSSGQAVFDNLIIDTADTGYQLTFSSGSLSDVTSNAFEIRPAAPDSMDITSQPGDTLQGYPVAGPPAVTLYDAYKNVISGIEITASVNKNTLHGTNTVTTNASGTAVFDDLSIDVYDSGYELIFDANNTDAPAVSNDTSGAFEIFEEKAVITVTNQPASSVAGHPVEGANVVDGPAVLVKNMAGDSLDNIGITASLSGGSLDGSSIVTDSTNEDGILVFDSLITTASGSGYQIVFSTGTPYVANVSSNAFDVLSSTGTMAMDQQPSESIEGYPVEGPPTIYLKSGGSPVSGVDVTAYLNKHSFDAGSKMTVTTNSSGLAVFDSLTIDSVDTGYQVVFKAAQSGVATLTSDSFDVVQEVVSLSVQQQPGLTIAGETINGPPSVQLTDISTGDPPASPVNVLAYINKDAFAGESDTIASATPDNNGIATFDSLIIDQADSGYKIRFSTNLSGMADVTTDSFEVVPVAGSMTIDPQPSETIEGYTLSGPPTITILDTNDDPIQDITVDAVLNKNSFASGITTLTTDANGKASFDDLIINEVANDYHIAFEVPDSTGVVSQASDTFDVEEETEILAVHNQPSLTIAGEIVNGPPSVRITDAGTGDPVPHVNIQVSLNKGSFTGGNTSVETNSNGVAVFDDLTIDSDDTGYELIFSVGEPGIADVHSNTFEVVPVAGEINITRQPQETVDGYPVEGPPAIEVLRKDDGTPMSGLDVTAVINQNDFTDAGDTTVTTDASGRAVFDSLILNQSGENYQITFTLPVSDSVPHKTTGTFDVVDEIAVMTIQNQPQLTLSGEPLNGPPEVKLENTDGTPINGGTIYATLNQSGFTTGSVTSATTNSSGIATFDSLAIDDANTGYELTFSSNSSGIAPITSDPFEIVAPEGKMEITQQPLETVNGETVAGPPTVTLKEPNGDSWEGGNVDITLTVNKNGFSGGTLTRTTSGGVATFDNLILNAADNNYKLTFSTPISERIPPDTSEAFDVVAVTGDMNITLQPSETVAGDPINGPPTVRLTDLAGDPVPDVNITVSLNKNSFSGGSTLTEVTDANGEAVFGNLVIDDPDTGYEIAFSSEASGVAEVTSDQFEVTDSTLAMEVTEQPRQSTAGETIAGPPKVKISDSEGGISGVEVTASINQNAFTGASTVTATTDDGGVAAFDNLILNAAATGYKITFNADRSGVPNTKSGSFEIISASADHIEVSVQPTQTQAGSAINGPPAAVLLDEFGNPVSGEDIKVVPNQNTNYINDDTVKTTGPNGEAVFDNLILTKAADDYQLFFTKTGVSTANSDFFAVTSAPADTIKVLTQPSETVAGAAISGPPEVRVEDQYGNPVQGETVTISEAGGYSINAGTLSLETPEDGVVAFNDLVIDKVDAGYRFRFSTGGIQTLSDAFNVVPGTIFSRFHGSTHSGFTTVRDNNHPLGQTPSRIEVVMQPQESVTGDEISGPPEIVVYDATDQPVSGVPVTVSGATFSSGNLTRTTDENGHIQYTDLVIDSKGTYNLTFTADTTPSVSKSSASFDVIDALATMRMNVQPQETTAGQSLAGPPTVLLENSIGMPMEGVDITAYINQHGFASGSVTVQTDENGMAVFDDLVINKAAENYQLIFEADYSGVENIMSNSFDVVSAGADSLSVEIQPGETYEGATIKGPPAAKVTDEYGNPVAGTDVFVTETMPGTIDMGILTITTDASGIASFSTLVINEKGTYQLVFSASGLTDAYSNAFQVIPGTVANRFKGSSHSGFGKNTTQDKLLGQTPQRISVQSQPQETVAGFNIEGPPEIVVYDAIDNPVPNVQVTVNAVGGSLDAGTFTKTTDQQGKITFNDLQIDDPGSYQLNFSADNHTSTVSDVQSAKFDVIDQVYTMYIETQPQNSVAGQNVVGAPMVSVKNFINQPLSGVDVTVYINQHNFASGTYTVQTDENGEAIFDDLVINKAAENYQLIFEADHSGINNVSSDKFNVEHADPSNLSIATQPDETTEGAAINGPPEVVLSDAFGNPVPDKTVQVAESGGYSFDGGTTGINTDENGSATFSDLVINTIGTYSLTFSNASVSDAQSQNFSVKSGTVSNRFNGSTHSGFGNSSVSDKLLGQTPTRIEVLTQPMETVKGTEVKGPPRIVVYDALDNTVANATINVSVSGGFKLGSTTQLTTNSEGEITFDNLVIESTGTYQLSFSAEYYSGVTAQSDAFEVINQQLFLSVTTQPGESTAGQNVTGHPTVQLANSIGQGYEGVDITVYLNQHEFASGSAKQTVTTDASGYAEFDQLVINQAAEGYQFLFEADYSGVLNVSSNAFSVVHASADHLSVHTDPEDTESGATIGGPPAITAFDAYDNPVDGVNVSVAETGGYNFDTGTTSATTDSNGIAAFDDLVIDATGQYSLTYSASGVSDLVSGSFSVISGTVSYRFRGSSHSGFVTQRTNNKYLGQTPTRIEIDAQPLETIVSDNIEGPPKVTVYDELDNPVSGVTIQASVDGFFTPGSVDELQTDANGEAVFDNLAIDETGTYTLTFDAPGYGEVDPVNSESFEVVNQMLHATVVTQPGESVAGSPVAGFPAVKLENEYGQGFQGVDVIARTNQYGYTATSTDTVTTDATGVATFDNLILENAADDYQIIFEVDYTGVKDVSTSYFDVKAGSASQMEMITQPTEGMAEAPIGGPPSIALYDAYNNPVSNAGITVSESGGYAFDEGTLTKTTDASGTAVFDDLVINTAGTYTLHFSASAGGVTDIQSDAFDILPANIANRFKGGTHSGFNSREQKEVLLQQVPTRIVMINQPDQSVANTPIQGPPSLRVYDQTDNPVGNAAVTASVVGGTPELSGTKTLTTNSSGEVQFDDISIGQTGTYQLYFEVGGYSGVNVNSREFEVINQTLSMAVDQQPQNTQAGQIIGGHPAVTITNEIGQPAPAGIDVIVHTNQNDFSSDPAYDTVQTDASGYAEFDQLVINQAADNYQLIFEADYPGVSQVTSEVFTVSPAPADHMQINSQPVDGEAGAVIAGPPVVGIYDAYNNPVTGVNIGVTEDGGEPITGTTNIASDENGEAVFDDLIIDNPGTYQLVFSTGASDVSNVSSSTFNIISTGTVHRFKGGSHSGFISEEITDQPLQEPPEVEQPAFTVYEDTLCQGTVNTDYTAEAANSDSVRYEITISSAGTVNEETGELDLVSDFYGEFYMKATAYGYQGPKSDSMKVLVEPEIDAPVFSDPVTEVCQGGTSDYTATSVHTDSISYSVMPSDAGTIDANGTMIWAADFSGSAQIIATAGEADACGGQKQTTVDVTVNPEVDTPTFTEGETEFCQDAPNETYTATASNASDIVYSRSPAESGVINSSTGEMDWAADFSGTVTITARAEGQCNGPKETELTVTVHPKPSTSAISGDADVACNATGKTYSVDLHTGASYAWSVPSGATITDGSTGPGNDSITVDFAESNGYVRVTETSQYGCVGEQQELHVTLYGCELASNFEASETETCQGNTVKFTDLSSGNPDTWEWDFGSEATPQTATGEGPHDVTYASEGTYSVSLTVKEQTVEDTKTVTDYITVSRKGVWLGNTSSDWFDPDNWSCGEVPDMSGSIFSVIISSSATYDPEISSDGARVRDIEIENGATLSIINGATLNLYGNWYNHGDFSSGNSTVVFRGDDAQIAGNTVTSFDNLQIITGKQLTASTDSLDIRGDFIADGTFLHNNAKVFFTGTASQQISGTADSLIFHNLIVDKQNGDLTLARHIDIASYLTLTEGVVNSSASELLRIMDNADSDQGSDTAYVDGPVQKTGNEAFTFPTGNNGVWAPIAITAPAVESDVFTAQYFYTGHPEAGNDPCSNCTGDIDKVKDTEYWDLSREAGSSAPDVTLYYKDMDRSGITSIDRLVYAHWNGSEWVDRTLEGSAQLDGSGGCSITGTGFSSYNIHAPAEFEIQCPNTGNIFYVPNDFDR